MDEVQTQLDALRDKGWSDAAIADEVGVKPLAVTRWRSGARHPQNVKLVIAALDALIERKRIPPKRRYEGTHHLQRRQAEREADRGRDKSDTGSDEVPPGRA